MALFALPAPHHAQWSLTQQPTRPKSAGSAACAQHLAELEALDGAAWKRTGRHGEHGEISIERYETHVAAEEVDHLAQISRILTAPSCVGPA